MSPAAETRRNAAAARKAFTLLELVAMLAVLALLIGVTASVLLTRVRDARRKAEQAELGWISSLWPAVLLQSRSLPPAEHWAEWMATNTSQPIQRIALNGSGLRRQVVFDPAMRLGRPAAAPPFVQSATGSLAPVQPRLIVVSGLTETLPDLQTFDFESLWTHAPDRWPEGWPAAWPGEPADLMLARVDLRHQFRHLILQNADPDANATCRIQAQSVLIAPGDAVDGWFLEGSSLELFAGSGSTPVPQTTERIVEDASFVFERGRWTRPPADGPAAANGMGVLVDRFLAAGSPTPTPRAAADHRAVVDEWVHFLNGFAQW
ncbi:MAG: hypothetical protein J0L84_17805, partial [Verrucomicrobia bacterium]|nr:hypothetical protein [Verrucomicrobiota bacterium]